MNELASMKDEYALEWAEYRRNSRHGIYALFAFLAAPFVMIPTFGLLLHFSAFQFLTHLGMLPFFVEAVLMLAAGYFGWWQYTWECPRCGQPFGRHHEECQNCALPKWATEDDSELSGSGSEAWHRPRI